MSQQIRRPASERSSVSKRAAVLAAAIMMTTPSWSNAAEPVHGEAKAAPCMDHSNMDGMKGMDCTKGADGATGMGCMSMTGDADYDFAANMRKHHQMGVDMSKAQLNKGKNSKMLEMANAIIAAQQKEIAVLDEWMAANKPAAKAATPK